MSERPPAADDGLRSLVARLEANLGAERVTLMRVRPHDWEARTYRGVVGRGHTLAEAIAELLEQLGRNLHGPEAHPTAGPRDRTR